MKNGGPRLGIQDKGVRRALIEFEHVSKSVGGTTVLSGVSLQIPDRELVVIAGPSGCGKTTTLKMINRLIAPTTGRVLIDGQDIARQPVQALRRSMGYVTQYAGLFEHQSVRQNLCEPLRLARWAQSAVDRRLGELASLFSLPQGEFMERYPYQLTAMERQRVCIARAFATDPEILLMDDPFAALEPAQRSRMQDELVTLQALMRRTVVFITSSIEEAIRIADRLCIMERGRVLQYDKPEEILREPQPGFVEQFVGRNRIFSRPQEIRASDIMITSPVTTHPEVPMLKGMEKMRLARVDSLLVVDEDGYFLGIVRAEHVHRCDNKEEAIKSVMREAKTTASPEETVPELLAKIRRYRVNAIPVVQNEKLVGLITNSSLVTILSQQSMELEEVEPL